MRIAHWMARAGFESFCKIFLIVREKSFILKRIH